MSSFFQCNAFNLSSIFKLQNHFHFATLWCELIYRNNRLIYLTKILEAFEKAKDNQKIISAENPLKNSSKRNIVSTTQQSIHGLYIINR